MNEFVIITTKKAAKDAGLKTADSWLSSFKIPNTGELPTIVRGEEYFYEQQLEELLTNRMAGEKGLSVAGVEPAVQPPVYTRNGWKEAMLYRESDCVPKRQPKEPVEIDLLLALWTVNRAAKRRRDLAFNHYNGQRYGLASSGK